MLTWQEIHASKVQQQMRAIDRSVRAEDCPPEPEKPEPRPVRRAIPLLGGGAGGGGAPFAFLLVDDDAPVVVTTKVRRLPGGGLVR